MSADRDITRIVRSWLRTDEHESADRVLDDVLALLDATPQRRSLWPARRIADMNAFAKFAVATAAVVVIAVAGINLLPASSGVGGEPRVSPSPSPSPTAPPSPSPTARSFPAPGDLSIGRHSMIRGGVPFSISLPTAGWQSGQGFFISKDVGVGPDGASFLFWDPDPKGVYADPCAHRLRPPSGPSPADLAADVSTIPGTDVVSGPSDVTVGGRDAIQVVITVPEDAPCEASEDSGFLLWYDEGPGSGCGGPPCPRYPSALGVTIRVWIVDVHGTRLFIEAESYEGAGPEVEQEIQQIVDSIRFE